MSFAAEELVTRPPLTPWGDLANRAIASMLAYDALTGRGAQNWMAAIRAWDDLARVEVDELVPSGNHP